MFKLVGISMGCVLTLACSGHEEPRAAPPPPIASLPASAQTAVPIEVAPTAVVPDLAWFPGFVPIAVGVADPTLNVWLAKAVPAVWDECLQNPATAVALSVRADVDSTRPGDEVVIVSPTYGIIISDGATEPKALARLDGPVVACSGAERVLGGVWVGQLVADAELEVLVKIDDRGSSAMVSISGFKRKGSSIETISSHVLEEAVDGKVVASPISLENGLMRSQARRSQDINLFRWNPDRYAFTLTKETDATPPAKGDAAPTEASTVCDAARLPPLAIGCDAPFVGFFNAGDPFKGEVHVGPVGPTREAAGYQAEGPGGIQLTCDITRDATGAVYVATLVLQIPPTAAAEGRAPSLYALGRFLSILGEEHGMTAFKWVTTEGMQAEDQRKVFGAVAISVSAGGQGEGIVIVKLAHS